MCGQSLSKSDYLWAGSPLCVGGYYVGVPVVLGAGGVEKIIQLELDVQEQADFQKSVDAVKDLVQTMSTLV